MVIETKRGPGRPRKHPQEPARIDVRLEPELRRRVRVAAAQRDMSLGEWAKQAFEEKLARDG